jgi:hypothetical protein
MSGPSVSSSSNAIIAAAADVVISVAAIRVSVSH